MVLRMMERGVRLRLRWRRGTVEDGDEVMEGCTADEEVVDELGEEEGYVDRRLWPARNW